MTASFSLIVYLMLKDIAKNEIMLYSYIILFTIMGTILLFNGISRLEKLEKAEVRYNQEKAIREILEQDYLLAKIKLAYNDLNKKNEGEDRDSVVPRDIKDVVKQAFDTNFYQRVYDLGKKKESIWKKITRIFISRKLESALSKLN